MFEGGPAEGDERIFIGACPADLYLIPNPFPATAPAMKWLVVGADEEPEEPWRDQAHYRLAGEPIASDRGDGLALYRAVA